MQIHTEESHSTDAGVELTGNVSRARELLGVKIGPFLSTGPLNAITDVPRVRVGMMERIVDDFSPYVLLIYSTPFHLFNRIE